MSYFLEWLHASITMSRDDREAHLRWVRLRRGDREVWR